MKHFYFSLLLFLLPAMAAAQERDYHPFIEEGKGWNMQTATWNMGTEETYTTKYTYEIGRDDIVINGFHCKKMNCSQSSDDWLLYESEKKVYVYNDWDDRFYLMYDFVKNIGEEFSVIYPEDYLEDWHRSQYLCRVSAIDSILTNAGIKLARFYLDVVCYYDGEQVYEADITWIEGVGSAIGPMNNMINLGATFDQRVTACSCKGNVMYEYGDQFKGTKVVDMKYGNDNGGVSKGGCYDLSGRRVTEPKKGIYIQNGRKRVR